MSRISENELIKSVKEKNRSQSAVEAANLRAKKNKKKKTKKQRHCLEIIIKTCCLRQLQLRYVVSYTLIIMIKDQIVYYPNTKITTM